MDVRIILKRCFHGNVAKDDLIPCDEQNVKMEIIKILLKECRFCNLWILSKIFFSLDFKGKDYGKESPTSVLDFQTTPPPCEFVYVFHMLKITFFVCIRNIFSFNRLLSQFKTQFVQCKMWSKLLNSLVWQRQRHSAISYTIFEKK